MSADVVEVWDEERLKNRIRLCEEQVSLQDARLRNASRERVFWSCELKAAKDLLCGSKQLTLKI